MSRTGRRASRVFAFLAMGPLLFSTPSAAEESDSDLSKIEARRDIRQDPEADLSELEAPPEYLDELGLPMPCTGPWDWIRFDSGEWMRGRLYRRLRSLDALQERGTLLCRKGQVHGEHAR